MELLAFLQSYPDQAVFKPFEVSLSDITIIGNMLTIKCKWQAVRNATVDTGTVFIVADGQMVYSTRATEGVGIIEKGSFIHVDVNIHFENTRNNVE